MVEKHINMVSDGDDNKSLQDLYVDTCYQELPMNITETSTQPVLIQFKDRIDTMISELPSIVPTNRSQTTSAKDHSFVSVFNDGDISELLYTKPVFSTGFLPLKPLDPKKNMPMSNLKSSPTVQSKARNSRSHSKSISKQPARPTRVRQPSFTRGTERRPSFVQITTPTVHHTASSQCSTSDSSDEECTMTWWPVDDTIAQHDWAEKESPVEEEDQDFDMAFWPEPSYGL